MLLCPRPPVERTHSFPPLQLSSKIVLDYQDLSNWLYTLSRGHHPCITQMKDESPFPSSYSMLAFSSSLLRPVVSMLTPSLTWCSKEPQTISKHLKLQAFIIISVWCIYLCVYSMYICAYIMIPMMYWYEGLFNPISPIWECHTIRMAVMNASHFYSCFSTAPLPFISQ